MRPQCVILTFFPRRLDKLPDRVDRSPPHVATALLRALGVGELQACLVGRQVLVQILPSQPALCCLDSCCNLLWKVSIWGGNDRPNPRRSRSLSFNLRSNMGSLPQPAKGIFVFILFHGFREIKKIRRGVPKPETRPTDSYGPAPEWIPAAACPRRLLSGAGMTDMRSRTSRPAIPAKAYPRMLPSRGGFIPGSPPGGSQRRGIC